MGFSDADRDALLRGRTPRQVYEDRLTPAYFFGRPRYVQSGSAHRALFGEQLICDGDAEILLPRVADRHVGLAITVCNIGSGTITILPPLGATIGGESSLVVDQPYDQLLLSAASRTLYLSRVSASATVPLAVATPAWEWNGSDLTQFGTATKGSGVTSVAATVETAFGSSWIQLEHAENSGVGAADANKSALLPITQQFGAAHWIEAQIYVDTFASGGYTGYGLAMGCDAAGGSTTPCTGPVLYHRPNTTPTGLVLTEYTSTTQTGGLAFASTGYSYLSTAALDRMRLELQGDAILRGRGAALHIGAVIDGAVQGSDAGLVSVVGGNSAAAGKIRYRDIKVWAI